jgi:hypothetical protein
MAAPFDLLQYERLVAPINQFLAAADRAPASRSRRGG